MFKLGDIIDYGGIICKITAVNSNKTSYVVKSEKGNIYRVKPKYISATTKLFGSKS